MKFKGLAKYKKDLSMMEKQVQKNVENLKEETLEVGYKSAREGVPVDTGELKDSITKGKDSLYVTAEHAEIVEYGSVNQTASLYMTKAREDMNKYLEENMDGVVNGK